MVFSYFIQLNTYNHKPTDKKLNYDPRNGYRKMGEYLHPMSEVVNC